MICITCMTLLYMNAPAENPGAFRETPIVTLVWGNRRVDVKEAEWDERSVLIHTEDTGLGNGKIYDYHCL